MNTLERYETNVQHKYRTHTVWYYDTINTLCKLPPRNLRRVYKPQQQLPLYFGSTWRAIEVYRDEWLALPDKIRWIVRHRLALAETLTITQRIVCKKHTITCECTSAMMRIEGLNRDLAHGLRELLRENGADCTIKRKVMK